MDTIFFDPSFGLLLLLASSTAKLWYLLPLIVVISLVYGGTRHESVAEILGNSIRSAIWLAGFLLIVFGIIWFAGYGSTSDTLTKQNIILIVCGVAWLLAGGLITLDAFQRSRRDGWKCLFSAGGYCLVHGFRHGHILVPTLIMLAALIWAVSTLLGG